MDALNNTIQPNYDLTSPKETFVSIKLEIMGYR